MPRKKTGLTAQGGIKPKKNDFNVNGYFNMIEILKRDEGKVMLRIDSNTIILVSKENNNEEYASNYRQRMEKAKHNY